MRDDHRLHELEVLWRIDPGGCVLHHRCRNAVAVLKTLDQLHILGPLQRPHFKRLERLQKVGPKRHQA
eukprot:CAMPEP_0177636158 /NCGR_PEP_ID=MMETSP0447-20121125/4287_1 /TAXON_ID=0 /ORGANISM="Stygamoeba regulata, Strain BSH-02190019" /LENGTH=67 /DNA_ID=CAMNT_0019137997 /DNA_START=53 /DNA_END=256 /DNA_ORIENTATION=-